MRLQRGNRWKTSGWKTSSKEGSGGRSVGGEDAQVLEGLWKGGIVARGDIFFGGINGGLTLGGCVGQRLANGGQLRIQFVDCLGCSLNGLLLLGRGQLQRVALGRGLLVQ